MSDKFAQQIRVSASRIKSLKQCSYSFYLREIEKLPDPSHPKAVIGSICHSIFECLKNPRHRRYYDIILNDGGILNTPFKRLVRMWQNKYNLDQSLVDEIDEMIILGLSKVNFYHSGATRVFPPEHKFMLELPTGIVKGFIDDLAIYDGIAKIRDYKSQKNKFTKEEISDEIQAAVYQLYVWKAFGIPAEVEFVLLRHPPSKRSPQNHIQIVPPKSEAELIGVEYYLEHMATVFKNFSLQDAYADFAADDKSRKWFCDYVCKYKLPFEYQCVTKDGSVVRCHELKDDVKLKEGEKLEIRRHGGCPRFSGKLY